MPGTSQSSPTDPWFQHLFSKRIGGNQYGKSNAIYKFEKIKRAKRAALAAHPERFLLDFGIGENMSYGFVASYLLSVDEVAGDKPNFDDRADVKVRFNANLGNVFKLDKAMDIYPGLNLGTRNFGAHLGFRYFFTEGFGVYTEAGVPLARYDSNVQGFDEYNNQFVFQIGASFNL